MLAHQTASKSQLGSFSRWSVRASDQGGAFAYLKDSSCTVAILPLRVAHAEEGRNRAAKVHHLPRIGEGVLQSEGPRPPVRPIRLPTSGKVGCSPHPKPKKKRPSINVRLPSASCQPLHVMWSRPSRILLGLPQQLCDLAGAQVAQSQELAPPGLLDPAEPGATAKRLGRRRKGTTWDVGGTGAHREPCEACSLMY